MSKSIGRQRGFLFPLYWSTYEQCFDSDQPIPEERFKRNVDWVAETLLPYGYNMIATDGWLGNSTLTNENGYLLKYSDDWDGDWDYWANYIISKGLVPGVYYNPMWVLEQAGTDPTKTIIGTDIPLSAIFNGGWVSKSRGCKRVHARLC
jgi:alpha-glucosidase